MFHYVLSFYKKKCAVYKSSCTWVTSSGSEHKISYPHYPWVKYKKKNNNNNNHKNNCRLVDLDPDHF